ncbi:MAG: UTP--glucose-1-phosphate uridylyltransferase, partial [archaeon]|nr:UTP--glucose-1-phosphate uridylyltransferase [archaeon]
HVQSPDPQLLRSYESLKECGDIKAALSKLVIIKFNGGLGTTMGLTAPQCALEVRDETTFLDIVVRDLQQINERYGADVPLLLMNSFNTEEKTKEIIGKYPQKHLRILSFTQSRHPRFWKDSLLPVPTRYDAPVSCWYPPGHGDVYMALSQSGLLRKMRAEGRQVAFISNINNAGATVDAAILQFLLDSPATEFIMELALKTRSDIKGGSLISYQGLPKLLEYSQVPTEFKHEFREQRFRTFNTNNLWVTLEAIDQVVFDAYLGGPHSLSTVDLIVNHKKLNDKTVIQLETAAGAAIKCFKNPLGLIVPRSRFLPVKNTGDLFLLQSNLFTFVDTHMCLNSSASFDSLPRIKFGHKFSSVDEYKARIPSLPDILELEHLTVSGEVWFGKNVVLVGTVIIVAQLGERIDIPDNSILENKIITGNLRILDH